MTSGLVLDKVGGGQGLRLETESAARDLIYVLLDPDTHDVRYVGKTTNPKQRMSQHRQDAKRRDMAVYRWWNELLHAGRGMPIMSVIASSVADDWDELEQLMIAQYRADGAKLLNVAKGGRQPFKTPDQMAKRGRALAAQVHSDPFRRRVWELKNALGSILAKLTREGNHERLAELRAKLAIAAARDPVTFGCYA